MVFMQKTSKLIVLLSVLQLSTLSAFCGTTLQGGVIHSEIVPAVEPTLRAGATFNESNIQKIPKEEGWYWVPRWIAGNWHREVQTAFTENGPVTQRNRSEKHFGMQQDSNGEIWDYYHVPIKQVAEGANFTEYKVMRSYSILPAGNGKFAMKSRSTCVRVDRNTNKIISSHTQEDINTFSPQGRGVIRSDCSMKIFDSNGRPKDAATGYYTCELVQPFQPTNYLDGKDLRQSFKNFLISHNWPKLVPLDMRDPSDNTGEQGNQGSLPGYDPNSGGNIGAFGIPPSGNSQPVGSGQQNGQQSGYQPQPQAGYQQPQGDYQQAPGGYQQPPSTSPQPQNGYRLNRGSHQGPTSDF
jgi:hypothetical protein